MVAAAIPKSLWIATSIITLQSFLTGYILCVLNPCLVEGDNVSAEDCLSGDDNTCPPGSVYRDLELSTLDASLATSLVILGGLVGSFACMKPGEYYGRKPTILFNNVFFILGGLLSTLADKKCLFIGRFISGIGIGTTSVMVPVLLAEISPDDCRGTITTMHQVVLTFSILISSLVGYGFVTYVSHGWQYCQALEVIPSLLMLIFSSWVPESPKWLISNNNKDEAITVLKSLRENEYDVDNEIIQMVEETSSDCSSDEVTWKEVFLNKKGLFIGCALMFIQAFTGINSVVFYSTTIFGFAGFKQAILATSSFGAVNFISTCISAYIIDIYGRKVLLFNGTIIMTVSLVVLSVALLSPSSSSQGIIAVIAVLTYTVGFAIGLGAVVWVMLSELMPTRSRTKAVSVFLSINWIGNFVIAIGSLLTIDALGGVNSSMTTDETQEAEKHGVAYLYIIFAIVSCISCGYIYTMVPETKGKKPEDFQDSTSAPLLQSESSSIDNKA